MRIHAIFVVTSVLFAATAFSQAREGAGAMFDRADANSDGVITREEFLAARANQFSTRDRNSDGVIDGSDVGERAAARPRVARAMEAMLKQFDANADGKVSKDEFVEGGAKVFDRADADQSGGLDAKEVEAAKARLKERAAQR